jgi:hypothetical protein
MCTLLLPTVFAEHLWVVLLFHPAGGQQHRAALKQWAQAAAGAALALHIQNTHMAMAAAVPMDRVLA